MCASEHGHKGDVDFCPTDLDNARPLVMNSLLEGLPQVSVGKKLDGPSLHLSIDDVLGNASSVLAVGGDMHRVG